MLNIHIGSIIDNLLEYCINLVNCSLKLVKNFKKALLNLSLEVKAASHRSWNSIVNKINAQDIHIVQCRSLEFKILGENVLSMQNMVGQLFRPVLSWISDTRTSYL